MKSSIKKIEHALRWLFALTAVGVSTGMNPIAVARHSAVVRGLAYDSLRGSPLAGAIVSIPRISRTTTSDSVGRFQFDSVPLGTHTATMLHDALDSVGLSGVSRTIEVFPSGAEFQIGIPSFESLWRSACGGSAVPSDSGFLFGTVLDARRGVPIAAAVVTASFTELNYRKETGVVGKRWSARSVTDIGGNYTLCGLPLDASVSLKASAPTISSGLLDVMLPRIRVHRRDLYMGDSADATGVVRGSIRLRLPNVAGSGVTVMSDGSTPVVSDAEGRFMLVRVPLGTRQLETRAIGTAPYRQVVDIRLGDTVAVDLVLDRAVQLEGVEVRGMLLRERRISEMELRRDRGLGRFMDSTALGAYQNLGTAISTLTSGIGSVCAIFLDGVEQPEDTKPVAFRHPLDIAQVEVHRSNRSPVEFAPRRRCGRGTDFIIVLWTKLGLPGR